MHLVTIQKLYMMELIKQRFIKSKFILGIFLLVLFNSCTKRMQDGKLECILESIKLNTKEMDIEVGQHNGWTDSTALILITYHRKASGIPISGNLKSTYKGNDIYFYESKVDSTDTKNYKQIPNNISWTEYTEEIDNDFFYPPYDPINIQVEYDLGANCFGEVIRGKGYIKDNIFSKCECKNK